MNNCNTSPLYVPTTIIAQIKNIDAVDVAATNISCTNLTVAGDPVSTILQNLGESSAGVTVFEGNVTADSVTSNGAITTSTLTSGTTNAGVLSATSVAATGDVSGTTLTGTLNTATQNNVTKIGTQTSFATSGSITQTGGSATLLGTTVSSLTCSGDLTVDTNVLKVNSTTNRVGVNITTPTVDLDVVGAAKISGNLNVDTSTLVVDATNNRVGVNTAAPTQALEVSGNVVINPPLLGALLCNGAIVSTGEMISGGYFMVNTTRTLGDDSAAFYVDATNKRVGVKTDNPQYDVDVRGNTSISGNLNVDTNTLVVNSTTNRVGVNVTSPSEALDVLGNIQLSGVLECSLNSFFRISQYKNSANQAITANTDTKALFPTAITTFNNRISNSTSQFTNGTASSIRVLAWYQIYAGASNAGTVRKAWMSVPGDTTQFGYNQQGRTVDGGGVTLSGMAVLNVPSASYFQVNFNADTSINLGANQCFVLIIELS